MSAPLPLLVNACGPECSSWASYHGITINKVYPDSDGFETTAPVGSFPKGASPFGALDMAGNVWEWVADYFDKYTVAEAKNPQGPDKGTDRVIRGGGWNAPESGVLRATFRHHAPPTKRSHGIGFRCARDGSIAKATLP
jgi:formylglycine-generating enzyme required for sulfatase activity